ncbi:TRAP transporter substrate-binding protein [Bacillus taeanensis]|nr:TRAP transporter substrate-binding protein [Bacillus taeanensis]
MKKLFSKLSCGLLMISMLAACGSQESATTGSEAEKSVKIIAAHVTDEGSPYQVGMEKFKEVVEAETNGSVTVEIHPNGELGGNEDELVQKMATGSVDVIVSSPGFMAQTAPEVDFFAMPYMFASYDHWNTVVDSEVGQAVSSKIEEKTDFKVLGYWSAGIRNYYGQKPVEKPADLKNVKVRVQNSPVVKDTWSAFGAQPAHVAWNELYQALQNGVVDAAENDFTNYFLSKQYEVAPKMSLTEHDVATRLFFMTSTKFENLSKEQQEAVIKAGNEASKAEREADLKLGEEYKQKLLDEGVEINEVEKTPFVESTEEIRVQTAEKLGMSELYEKVKETK